MYEPYIYTVFKTRVTFVRHCIYKDSIYEVDPRPEDLMDPIENSILERREVRIEHRWLEIERMRSLAYWYPFYARNASGESSDDCCDPDRLISFEDDLSPFLFQLSDETEKLKLLLILFKHLGIVSSNGECFDLGSNRTAASLIQTNQLGSDDTFLRYVCESCSFLSDPVRKREQFAFLEANPFLDIVIQSVFNINATEKERQLYELTAHSFVGFVRNCLSQALNAFRSVKLKTFLTVLRWRFELALYRSLLEHVPSQRSQIASHPDLDPSRVKEALLNQAKLDLSLETNRSNFDLWKEYAVLKYIINKGILN